MATKKLWWNGSEWKTSSAYWINSSKTGNNQVGITYHARLVAYDDMSIRLQTAIESYQTASIYWTTYWEGSVKAKSGSTTIGTNEMDKAVTSYSSISISGSLYAYGKAGSTDYSSGALSFSGSINLSSNSPFRTITYNVNGGSGSPGTQKVLKGISAKVTPAATPTKTSYTFTGWNTAANGSGTKYNNNSTITTSSDLTLYAQWSQNTYSVGINAGEGTTITFNGDSYSGTTDSVNVTNGSYPLTITANDGYIIKTRSHNDGNVSISDNSTVISATAQHVGCRVDDGEQWVQALVYYDDGENWVMCQAYYDDGEQWILLN